MAKRYGAEFKLYFVIQRNMILTTLYANMSNTSLIDIALFFLNYLQV